MIEIYPISKENGITFYANTILYNSEEEYNKNSSGVYIDYDNNLIKLKNKSGLDLACWCQLHLFPIYDLDEFYIEYEIRNCSGEPLKLSLESLGKYRYNSYANSSSEWEKHITKIVVNNNKENGTSNYNVLSIGNSYNINFSCEIRNIKIKQISNKGDYISFIRRNFHPKSFFVRTVYASNKILKISSLTLSSDSSHFYSINFILNSQKINRFYSLYAWGKTYGVTNCSLTGVTGGEHFEFYTVDDGNKVTFYAKLLRQVNREHINLVNSTSLDHPVLFEVVNELPSNAVKVNIESYTCNLVSSVSTINTPYHVEKMKQEGVYDDYISYMDEKTAYDKQQRKLEQDRQLSYEETLKENPNLTYEEFVSVQPMTLNLVEEPQPSQALQKFMDKYL